MSYRPTVVITHRVHDPVKNLLAGSCQLISNDDVESWSQAKLLEAAQNAEALLVFMPDRIDEAFLSECPRLKVIAAALKGCDNIDVSACTRRGIWVTVVPGLLSQPTAELALALTLGLSRNILAGDRLVRSGKFQGWRPVLYGSSLAGKTVGIIGMGHLGQAFVRLLAGFNARIVYYDPVRMSPVQEAFLGISHAACDDVLAQSDFVVLMVPLTDSTLHTINANTLAKMKTGAYLVNVCRGSVVDEAAVSKSLECGHLAGYAADTFAMEDHSIPNHPAEIYPGLLASERTLLTPHLGTAVNQVRLEIEMAAAQSILQALRGERPSGAVNEPQIVVRK